MKPTGRNTAAITNVMDTMAPVISCMASAVAILGGRCLCSILAWTASTTTIASSTTIPIANTNANNVRRLMEKPNNCIKKKVPKIATGTAIAGISVDLKSWRKINTTMNTSIKASIKVCCTCSMD
ncbi:hypothetical protein D3C87_1756220 [compost metagenome]